MFRTNANGFTSKFLLKICLLGFSLFLLFYLLEWDTWIQETPVVLANNEAITFMDVTDLAQVNLTAPQWGAAWADYDGDGYQDLYTGNHFDSPNLYRNNGDGTFTDVRAQAGLETGPNDWHGAVWGDYNNDGFPDLYVVTGNAIAHGSYFYRNNGNGTFTESSDGFNIENYSGRGRQPTWIDYDRDGNLDLFVANADKTTAPSILYRNINSNQFTDVAIQAGLALTTGIEATFWADYDDDGYMDFAMIEPSTAGWRGFRLRRNQGNGVYTDVTNSPAGLLSTYWPTGVAWGDYDNDGDLDLFFSRGYKPLQDKLIWNTKTITAIISPPDTGQEGLVFTTTTPTVSFDLWKTDRRQYRSETALGSMNKQPASMPFTLDNSSTDHLGQPPSFPTGINTFVWRNDSSAPWNIYWKRPAFAGYELVSVITTPGEFTEVTADGLDIPPSLTYYYPNTLYRNIGNGQFQFVSNAAGMADVAANTQDAQWIDVDNDGDLDLYTTNMGNTYSGDEPNRLYRNNGNGTFTDIAAAAGLTGPTSGNDMCSAWADYNNDGFLDMYLANNEWTGYLSGPHKLYLNGGNTNHWLEIKLTGIASNRSGIGAKIKVTTGDLTQLREVGPGGGKCQNSLVAHFGLDDYTIADVITITWPSGYVQTLRNVPADQLLNIQENSAPEADLSVEQVYSGPGQIVAGERLTYTVLITNFGPTTPVSVTLENTFSDSAALSQIGDLPGCVWTSGSTTVTCILANISTGTVFSQSWVVTTSSTYSGTLGDTVTIAPVGVVDPELSHNSSSLIVKLTNNSGSILPKMTYIPIIVKVSGP